MIHLGDIAKISGYTAPPVEVIRCPCCGNGIVEKQFLANRDWLNSLSTVELVCWIKNTASAMSDAELLKWLEEKHEK